MKAKICLFGNVGATVEAVVGPLHKTKIRIVGSAEVKTICANKCHLL
jgi:hypothetical protein